MMMIMIVLMNMSILTGFNIAYRRQRKSKIGPQHKISKEEAMKWFQQKVYLNRLNTNVEDVFKWKFMTDVCRILKGRNHDFIRSVPEEIIWD